MDMDTETQTLSGDELSSKLPKTPVVRGARACTVCRAAKMKCVPADDGEGKCQRCKRAGVECVFEKHRRGRKPGSKLSEASKMLRRLEKGLNSAKAKQSLEESSAFASGSLPHHQDTKYRPRTSDPYPTSSSLFPSNELPPLSMVPHEPYASRDEEEEDEADPADGGMFPARLINKENQRNSFFSTILNPEQQTPQRAGSHHSDRPFHEPQQIPRSPSLPPGPADPIDAGLMDYHAASTLFDVIFLRFNPFICLFDPVLHSVNYVRSRCPFLFTTLIMAGCKFFKPELYKSCQKIAQEMAVRAFAEGWKSVEVVQAFACLTYWKEPDDTRTWTYIGYACRMAVELGLNKYTPRASPHETDIQIRERRNRERTYLVLFVHDRSLSMQTGRQWMLPEDDLVRHSNTWHEEGGNPIRPEDVILAAFVQLRRIAAETTDVFYLHKGVPGAAHNDVNYEALLRNCNGKLTQWMDSWNHEMRRASGDPFHFSVLNFFRLHVRLFLNSFGIQASMSPQSRTAPSLQALTACYTSALDTLKIVVTDFASMSMLRYVQDSITVMTAYSAIFLLKLLRSSNTLAELNEGATNDIYSQISKTADSFQDASAPSDAYTTAAAYHARFLRSLVVNDMTKARQTERERANGTLPPIDTRMSTMPNQGLAAQMANAHSPPNMYPQQMLSQHDHGFHVPTSPHGSLHPGSSFAAADAGYAMEESKASDAYHQPYPHQRNMATAHHQQPHSELDAHYWRHMFRELGFGEGVDTTNAAIAVNGVRGMPYSDATIQRTAMPYHPVSQHQHQQHAANGYVAGHPGHAM